MKTEVEIEREEFVTITCSSDDMDPNGDARTSKLDNYS